MRRSIDQFRRTDRQYREHLDEHAELKSDLQSTFAQIQSLADDFPDEEERKVQLGVLDQAMTQLSELIKLNEEETSEYAGSKFLEFKTRYPGIFKMFLKGDIDQQAFDHVLDTLTLLEQGQISLEEGKEMGYYAFANK